VLAKHYFEDCPLLGYYAASSDNPEECKEFYLWVADNQSVLAG
jgi:hypothetical protein